MLCVLVCVAVVAMCSVKLFVYCGTVNNGNLLFRVGIQHDCVFCIDVGILKALVRGNIECKELVKDMRGEVEHLHYICARIPRGALMGDVQVEEGRLDRLTQYVPCCVKEDLNALETKLGEENFRQHAVSEFENYEIGSFCVSFVFVGFIVITVISRV